MKRYYVIYLPTGHRVNDREGNAIVLTGSSERGAKMKYSRDGHYLDWNLHTLYEVTP